MTSTPEDLAADLAACEAEVSYERMARRIDRFPQVVRELIEAREEIDRLRERIAGLERKDGAE